MIRVILITSMFRWRLQALPRHLAFMACAIICGACFNEQSRDAGGIALAKTIPQEIKTAFPSISAPPNLDSIVKELPAQFSSRGFKLLRDSPSLSGEELYLLPNSNYVHVGWADIHTPTVHETGIWSITNGLVQFTPLHTGQWTDMRDREFFSFFFNIEGKRVLVLMGSDFQLSQFKETQKLVQGPVGILLNSMTCVRPLDSQQAEYFSKCLPDQEVPREYVLWQRSEQAR